MPEHKTAPSRRLWLGGAASAGAAALAVSALPTAPTPPRGLAAAAPKPVDPGAGYQLTEHVKRYYRTARV